MDGGRQQVLPFSGHTFMLIVGVVEILAGLPVAVKPTIATCARDVFGRTKRA